MVSIAERMFDGGYAQVELEDELSDVGLDVRIGWDHYDCSIELYEVEPDVRLTKEQQKVICAAGFRNAYVNHKDGWETHYGEMFRANAHLIAAAPDMLAALKHVEAEFRANFGSFTERVVRAAIAKAEGRTSDAVANQR